LIEQKSNVKKHLFAYYSYLESMAVIINYYDQIAQKIKKLDTVVFHVCTIEATIGIV
jgi:hypothetical protein